MSARNYLQWLTEETQTRWWHDSAIPDEIDSAIENGALGVTTNPVLTYRTLQARPEYWEGMIKDIKEDIDPDTRAEEFLQKIASHVAGKLKHIYESTDGEQGYACGQLDPTKAGDADKMFEMAKRVHQWGSNITIKLPSTAAGLEVIEEMAADSYAICATINFSVAQAIAVAESFEKGTQRALEAGKKPGICFAVQQVGRVDDYIRDVAKDARIDIEEEDIKMAGIAVAKRAYGIFKKRGYRSKIMPAGLRGPHHLTELAGGDMTFSIHPMVQKMILEKDLPQEEKIEESIKKDVIERLMQIPDFVRAYEPDGLKANEFITFGIAQRTLSQFVETGWYPLQTYGIGNVPLRWK